jgi:phosphatidylserine/phosphatidylglycerophosphate/cardiolipin synthase-like enzyme
VSTGGLRLEREGEGDTLAVRFLAEGGQRPVEVAGWLADFLGRARRSLDLAFYDVRLSDRPALLLRRILADRVAAGVRVRLAYDAGDKPQTPGELDLTGVEPAPRDTHERVVELGLSPRVVRAVRGPRELMHHKYVVRDGEAVWTGSLNLSDDSMGRMENLVVALASPALAAAYARDFLQLWGTGKVVASGGFDAEPALVRFAGEAAEAAVAFSPGRGAAINEAVAARVAGARRRVVVCSMLVTSSRILRALVGQVARGEVAIEGVYDGTQMAGVLDQWRERADLAWKVEAFARVARAGGLVGKRSLPFRPGGPHNFMHNKTLVVDDTVITGSHNLSHAAQDNAENVLAIESPALAEAVVGYARGLAERYRAGPGGPGAPATRPPGGTGPNGWSGG